MSLDITSLAIQVTSQGISEATKALDGLVTSANNAERAFPGLKTVAEAFSASQKSSVDAIESLLIRLQKQADLLGTNQETQNAYNATLLKASDSQVELAASLGATVDAYKQNEIAQKRQVETSVASAKAQKDLENSYKSLHREADAYYNALASAQAKGNALNQWGQYKAGLDKVADAERTLTQETKILEAAESKLNKSWDQATLENQRRSYKNLADAQSEAIKMNKQWDAGVALNVQGMRDIELAEKRATSGMHDFNLVTAGSTRELIVLGHEVMQGNFSRIPGSILVMGERINFLPKALASATSAAAALGVSLGVLIGVVAVVVASVALIGVNLYKAHEALVEFNNAVIMTGHSIGATGQELNGMATDLGSTTGHITQAREAILKLAETGRFTSDQINLIATAAVNLNKYAGVSIEDTIKHFEKLAAEPTRTAAKGFDGISKAAFDLDKQLHFLTPTVLDQIIAFEHHGQAAEASKLAIKTLGEEENKRTAEMRANLTVLGGIADDVATSFKKMWNSLFTKGSLAQQLQDAETQLTRMQKDHDYSPTGFAITKQLADIKKLKDQVAAQDAKDKAEQEKATQDSLFKQDQMWQNSYVLRAKGNENFQEMLQRNAQFEQEAEARGIILSEEDKQRARLGIVKAAAVKEKAIRSEGLTDVNSQIAAIEAENEPRKRAFDYAIKLIDQEARYKLITEEEAADKKDKILKMESDLMAGYYAKELDIVKDFHAKSKNEANEAATLRSNLEKKISDLQEQNTLKAIEAQNKLTFALNAVERKKQTTFEEEIKGLDKSIDTINAKIYAYENLSASQKAQGVSEKQLQDQVTEGRVAELEAMLRIGVMSENEIDRIQRKIDKLREEESAQKRLETLQTDNSAALAAAAKAESAWKAADKSIEDGLYKAISEGGGKAFKKLLTDVKEWFARLVLQPIIAPIAAFGASFLDPTAASAQGNAGAGVGGSIGAAQTAYSLYSAVSKGFDSIASSVTNGLNSAYATATGTSGIYGPTASGGNIATTMPGSGAAGTAAAYAAGIAAGKGIGDAISGQFGIGGHGSAVVNIGTAIGSIFAGPIGGAIGGAIGGLLNRAFGMGSKNVTSQGIRGNVSDANVTATNYSNWHQDGGWFRSDKNGTDTKAASQDILNTFASGLGQMKQVSTDFAKSLNIGADALTNYSKDFDITLTNDAAANQKAITDFFTTMGDDMATKLVPNIADFARVGETASVTLQRLSETFTATNTIADMLGKTAEQAFGGIGLASDAARERLVTLAGGIQALGTQTTFYAQNFLTDAQKIAPVQKAVSEAMASIGESSVTTIEQFKNLVDSLDLTKQSDAETFTSLMKLAPAFKAVADASSKLADDLSAIQAKQHELDLALLEATGHAQEAVNIRRQDEIDALYKLSPALADTQRAINAALDATAAHAQAITDSTNQVSATQGAVDEALALLQRSAQAQKDVITAKHDLDIKAAQDQLTVATTAASAIKSVYDSLVSTVLDGMQMTRNTAKSILADALSSLNAGGSLSNISNLGDALKTISQPSQNSFSTLAAYQKDQGRIADTITHLKDGAGNQLKAANETVDAINVTIKTIEETSKAQIAAIDSVLTTAQNQVDYLKGIDSNIVSMAVALDRLATTLDIARQAQDKNAALTGTTLPKGAFPTLTQAEKYGGDSYSFDSANDYTAKLNTVTASMNADAKLGHIYSLTDAFKLITGHTQAYWQEAQRQFDAGLHPSVSSLAGFDGSHADGLDSVPKDNYKANLHIGERVQTAKAAKDADKTAEEIRQLKSQVQVQNLALIQSNAAMEKIFRKWDGEGIPSTRTV